MKGQRALAQQMTTRDAEDRARYTHAAEEAHQPSFAEQQREQEFKAHQEWKARKDYRKPPPGLIAMGMADPAQKQRMIERSVNMTPTGMSAWGAEGNPTAIALAKENIQAHRGESEAAQYEGDVRAEDMYQRTGVADSLIAQDWARKSGLLASTAGMSQFATQARINTQPKSILPALLSAGIGAAGMLLGGPAFGAGGLFGGGATGGANR